jgi:Putative zincin peptidase
LHKICDYNLPRTRVYFVAIFLGILAGVANSFLAIDLRMRPILGGWILVSLILVIILHEAIHGATAAMLGHKPQFGLKPPLVYITFAHKIPRNHFILIAVAPFVLLDILFILLYARGVLNLFCDLCLIINSIGAVGDIWVALKLLQVPKQSLILDTKTGFEVWTG